MPQIPHSRKHRHMISRSLCLALVAAALPLGVHGQQQPAAEAKTEPAWNIQVDVEMVAMPQELAIPLVPKLQSDDQAELTAAVSQIQQLIANKRATLTGWPMVVTVDGQRAVSETIVEKRYPSDFEIQKDEAPPAAVKDQEKPADGAGTVPLVPGNFETRNIGPTLEVEPKVMDGGKRIVISMVPQRVALNGYQTFQSGTTGRGKQKETVIRTLDQPEFATTKVTTTISIKNSEHMLIAIHRIDTPQGQIEFFILHAVATKLD